MKGIILAGGSGTRLHPLTKVTSKQLLPVYDKPMIYYPLTTLVLAGIEEVLVITRPEDRASFQALLGDGSQFEISIKYAIQEKPAGLAQAPLIAEEFLNGQGFCLILGDNFLYGPGLGRSLRNLNKQNGATIFAYSVPNPSDFGVVTIDESGKPISIVEKPVTSESKLAIPGLYFFDSNAVDMCKSIKPSPRGELEITDLIRQYLESGNLSVNVLPIGTAWLDMGSFESLLAAGEFVKLIQNFQQIPIGDPVSARKFVKQNS
jgi:glucose-1-phosphate thymidylyltransferase